MIELDTKKLIFFIVKTLDDYKNIEQPKEYHPEGCLYNHIKEGLSYLLHEDLILILTWIFHDYGKIETFKNDNGKITFHNHCEIGAKKVKNILESELDMDKESVHTICWLIKHHHVLYQVGKMSEKTLNKYKQNKNFEMLVKLAKLDSMTSNNNLSWVVELYEKGVSIPDFKNK